MRVFSLLGMNVWGMMLLLSAGLMQGQEEVKPVEVKEKVPVQVPAEEPKVENEAKTEPPRREVRDAVKEQEVRSFRSGESYEGKVVVIRVGEADLMNPAKFEFMSRALKRASEENAEAVLFDMDTPGGMAWNTTTMAMEDLQKMKVKTVTYVNPRALSAGALIALGTDAIYMGPVSTIGAATPVSSMGGELGEAERAKMNSALMAMARSAAKAKGHREEVANSMVDKDVGLKIGDKELVPKGQICSLDQDQATQVIDGKPVLAKAVAKDLEEVKRLEGLRGESVVVEPKGFEMVAIWITQYAAVLLLIGLAAGYLEMQAPGFGLPGIVAAMAFFLFFFGHYVAGSLVGYETLAIFILGVALIMVEFFVFPGVVLPGLVGLVMVVGALVYTMAGWEFTVPEGGVVPVRWDDYAMPLVNMALAFIGAVVVILLTMRFLPDVGPFRHMVLQTAVGGAQASIEGERQRMVSKIEVGSEGVTRTAMRPYGDVEFEGAMMEAMSEGDYLLPGTAVKVKSLNGGKVVVVALEKDKANG